VRVDAQAHVASPDRETYPIKAPDIEYMAGANARWFDIPGFSAEDLLRRMDEAGVDRAVLVQAYGVYGYDNRYTADAFAAHRDRLAWVCIIDVEDRPEEAIQHWVTERGARGVRLFLRNASPGWLGSAACDDVFAAIQRAGAVAQVLATEDDLGLLLDVARRHPDLPILLDHCAMPDLSGGDDYPNAKGLFAFAAAPNASVKLSDHVFALARDGGSTAARITERLVDRYGAARVQWASDYTIHNRVYTDCVADAQAACAALPPTDQALFLGDAAAAMWFPGA
jgi:predicted TIM-barrel fold metal-dependent hydrolase